VNPKNLYTSSGSAGRVEEIRMFYPQIDGIIEIPDQKKPYLNLCESQESSVFVMNSAETFTGGRNFG